MWEKGQPPPPPMDFTKVLLEYREGTGKDETSEQPHILLPHPQSVVVLNNVVPFAFFLVLPKAAIKIQIIIWNACIATNGVIMV